MRYRISTEDARAAVRPTPLVDVLKSLRDNGVISAFRIDGADLEVEAEPGVELAFVNEASVADPRLNDGAYYVKTIPPDASMNPACHRRDFALERGVRHAGHLREETSGAYYRQAAAFMHTAAFRRLTPTRRAMWRLHAQGMSKYEIADKLGCTSGSVARALLMIRPAAGLGRTARTISRGKKKETP